MQYSTANFECERSFVQVLCSLTTELQVRPSALDSGLTEEAECETSKCRVPWDCRHLTHIVQLHHSYLQQVPL